MASVKELLARQEHAMNKIYRALPNFKKLGQAHWALAIVKQRLTMLKSAFTKCEELDLQIQMGTTETHRSTVNYFVSSLYYRCEESFHEAADFMTNAQDALESSLVRNTSVEQPHAGSSRIIVAFTTHRSIIL